MGNGNLKTCLFTAESGSNFWVKSTLRECGKEAYIWAESGLVQKQQQRPEKAGQGALRIQGVKSYTNEQ